MDGIARLLRRKVRDVEIDPRLARRFRLACIFVIADEKLPRAKDVESLLIENTVSSGPARNLRGQGTERCSRRKIFVARMSLKHKRCSQHEHIRNSKAK